MCAEGTYIICYSRGQSISKSKSTVALTTAGIIIGVLWIIMIVQASVALRTTWLSTGQALAVLFFIPLVFISLAYFIVLLFFRWPSIVEMLTRQLRASNIAVWKRILLNGLAFLGLGGFISYGIGLFLAPGHDIPRELAACLWLFIFACASPGFLIPYCCFAKKLNPNLKGRITVLVGGLLYPILLFWLNNILIKLLGDDVAQFDKLVEVQGWLPFSF
jgi:hypothetical protein